MIRRALSVLFVACALGTFAGDAQAQLNPGIHVARAFDAFGGANGIGGSLELGFPLFPIDVFVAGEYFFPDCGSVADCSYMGGSADLHFSLPVPMLTPYATAGVVYRRMDAGIGAVADTGFGAGVGVNLGALVLGGYAEARYEFVGEDDQVVVRVGLRF